MDTLSLKKKIITDLRNNRELLFSYKPDPNAHDTEFDILDYMTKYRIPVIVKPKTFERDLSQLEWAQISRVYLNNKTPRDLTNINKKIIYQLIKAKILVFKSDNKHKQLKFYGICEEIETLLIKKDDLSLDDNSFLINRNTGIKELLLNKELFAKRAKDRLIDIRINKFHLSPKEFCENLSKLTYGRYMSIERGDLEINRNHLAELYSVYDISSNYILFGKGHWSESHQSSHDIIEVEGSSFDAKDIIGLNNVVTDLTNKNKLINEELDHVKSLLAKEKKKVIDASNRNDVLAKEVVAEIHEESYDRIYEMSEGGRFNVKIKNDSVIYENNEEIVIRKKSS